MSLSRFSPALVLVLLAGSQVYADPLSFTSPSLEMGDPLTPGTVYRYSDVLAGVDALLAISGLFNSASLDGIGSGGAFGGDDLVINLRGWGTDPANGGPSYGNFSLSFVAADTRIPVTLVNLQMSVYNITSEPGFDFSNTLWLPQSVPATLRDPTNLEILPGGNGFAGFNEISLLGSNNFNDGGPEETDPNMQELHTVDFSYASTNAISLRWGLTGTMSIAEDDNGKDRALVLTGDGVLIPIPAAAYLFASCLGALGWFRRKVA